VVRAKGRVSEAFGGWAVTAVVLALAGLTCDDAGPGLGAARAPAAVSLVGEWTGTERFGEADPREVVLSAGTLTASGECGLGVRAVCFVSTDKRGRTSAAWGGVGFRVSWRQEGRAPPSAYLRGHLLGTEILITLRPAAPRKP
jgi:hypothetical protein